jgi:Ca2+-binding RTX toxin-like protein
MALIKGNAKKNTLIGTDFSDLILGLGNDDRLFGGAGDDAIKGGTGNDKLYGGAGNDKLFGEAGDDLLNGGKGHDTMRGGAGNDSYIIDDVKDKVIEGAGQGVDTVRSSLARTNLGANVENLVLTGHTVDQFTHTVDGAGNALDNVITGNSVANALFGAAGDDTLYGGAGRDNLDGGDGGDKLSGGADADVISGSGGFDFASYQSSAQGVTVNVSVFGNPLATTSGFVRGVGGDAEGDLLIGVEGLIGSNFNDDLAGDSSGVTGNIGTFLIGGGGDDILHGGALDDFLIDGVTDIDPTIGDVDPFFNVIGSGNDQMFGGDGDDSIDAGVGADLLDGGSGNDRLVGRAGADILIGGASPSQVQNHDTFVYFSASDSGVGAGNRDRILDFTQGLDKIDLSVIDTFPDPVDDSFFFGGQKPQGDLGFIVNPPQVSFYFEAGNTIVQGFTRDASFFAINHFEIELTGHIVLTANDFVL